MNERQFVAFSLMEDDDLAKWNVWKLIVQLECYTIIDSDINGALSQQRRRLSE